MQKVIQSVFGLHVPTAFQSGCRSSRHGRTATKDVRKHKDNVPDAFAVGPKLPTKGLEDVKSLHRKDNLL